MTFLARYPRLTRGVAIAIALALCTGVWLSAALALASKAGVA